MRTSPRLRHAVLAAVAVAFCSTGNPARAQIITSTILNPTSPTAYYSSNGDAADNGIQTGYGTTTSGGTLHALVWNSTSAATDITPAGYVNAQVQAVSGNLKGGVAAPNTTSAVQAFYWNASNVATDIQPGGYLASFVQGMTQTQEVGYGVTSSGLVALLWDGTTFDGDITPYAEGYSSASAYAISGALETGSGSGQTATGGAVHVLYWNNGVFEGDLNPSGAVDSRGYGISGNLIAGYASFNGATNQAEVWNVSQPVSGTNPVELTPATFSSSEARAISGNEAVGFGAGAATLGNNHALLWQYNGTSWASTDLNAYSPAGITFTTSQATGVAPNGSIVGTATYTVGSVTTTSAVLWTMVPAPGALPVLTGGFAMVGSVLTSRRRRRNAA